jgi:hypothetical protein
MPIGLAVNLTIYIGAAYLIPQTHAPHCIGDQYRPGPRPAYKPSRHLRPSIFLPRRARMDALSNDVISGARVCC